MACGLPSAGKHIRDLLLHRRIESPVAQQTVQQIPPLPCCKQFRERNPVAGGQMFPVPCIHDPGSLVKTGHILPQCLEERGIDLPEDRKGDGIIADLSVRDNIILALQVIQGMGHPFSRAQAEAFADEYIKALEIKTASQETPVGSLSGGNQQKVILARWLLTHPDYLILDEPTRGIDVGTKTEIQKLVLKLAEEGMSITFISSEIEEMLRTCSRLIVMRDRNIVGELKGEDLTQDRVMRTIAGEGRMETAGVLEKEGA